MNRAQYKIIKRIIKSNHPKYYKTGYNQNIESDAIYFTPYDEKYGALKTFKTIRGYLYNNGKNFLSIDHKLLNEFQDYKEKRVDFYLFKVITLAISFIALIVSIIAITLNK